MLVYIDDKVLELGVLEAGIEAFCVVGQLEYNWCGWFVKVWNLFYYEKVV